MVADKILAQSADDITSTVVIHPSLIIVVPPTESIKDEQARKFKPTASASDDEEWSIFGSVKKWFNGDIKTNYPVSSSSTSTTKATNSFIGKRASISSSLATKISSVDVKASSVNGTMSALISSTKSAVSASLSSVKSSASIVKSSLKSSATSVVSSIDPTSS